MPRDYAKTSSRNNKPGQLPGWIWMLGGLSIGLFVAFLVYLNNSTHPSQKNALVEVIKDAFSDVREVKKEKSKPPPPPKLAKKANTQQEKHSFDFYYILPELEVRVPDEELVEEKTATSLNAATSEINYIVQAGAFRQFNQADNLKAKLALNGFVAKIHTIKKTDGTWHRVLIGPLQNITRLNQTRKELGKIGVPTVVIKPKS